MAADLEHIKQERAFLHDMASPLTIALGMTSSGMSLLKAGQMEEAVIKLEKAQKALDRMREGLEKRREKLITASESAQNQA